MKRHNLQPALRESSDSLRPQAASTNLPMPSTTASGNGVYALALVAIACSHRAVVRVLSPRHHLEFSQPDSHTCRLSHSDDNERRSWGYLHFVDCIEHFHYHLRIDVTGPEIDNSDQSASGTYGQCAEVAVVCHNDPAFSDGNVKDFRVRRTEEVGLRDRLCLNASFREYRSDDRVDVLVQKEGKL